MRDIKEVGVKSLRHWLDIRVRERQKESTLRFPAGVTVRAVRLRPQDEE